MGRWINEDASFLYTSALKNIFKIEALDNLGGKKMFYLIYVCKLHCPYKKLKFASQECWRRSLSFMAAMCILYCTYYVL